MLHLLLLTAAVCWWRKVWEVFTRGLTSETLRLVLPAFRFQEFRTWNEFALGWCFQGFILKILSISSLLSMLGFFWGAGFLDGYLRSVIRLTLNPYLHLRWKSYLHLRWKLKAKAQFYQVKSELLIVFISAQISFRQGPAFLGHLSCKHFFTCRLTDLLSRWKRLMKDRPQLSWMVKQNACH